jgi:uncharacterized iron-regulated protein
MNRKGKLLFSQQHGFLSRYLPFYVGVPVLILVALMLSFAVNAFSSRPDNNEPIQPIPADQLTTFNLGHGKTLADIIEYENQARLFFVGESHTRLDHHLVQLATLETLFQQNPNVVLGVEWFQQPFQSHLDDYINGNISEAQMLHLTEYYNRWRYDYRLYQPIMQFARKHKIPVIALNASAEVNRAVNEYELDELPENLKSQLPDSYDWSDKAYEQRLRDTFNLHPEFSGKFEDFYKGQLTWDESMAYRAASFLKDNPEHRMLVLAGSGHIEYGSGIPNRVKRHIDIPQVSILITDGRDKLDKEVADYLVISREKTVPANGLIGAFLETIDNRLTITDFSKNSAARDAGIPKDSIIVSVDDNPVNTFADFKIAVLNKKPGDQIKLGYLANPEKKSTLIKSASFDLR